jgi:hypothetical protein
MASDLTWKTEKRKICDLKDHKKNPRKITKDQMEQLKKSIDNFNYVEIIAINLDGTILAGHMRTKALKELGRGKEEIEVRVPSRMLTEQEADEYLIRSNKNTGEWDFDILANEWDTDDLLQCGFTDKDFHFNLDDPAEDDEVDEKDVDETLTDNLELNVRFIINIPNEDSTSFKNQLTEILKGFPRAKLEEKI